MKNSSTTLRRAEAASWGRPQPQKPEIKILRVVLLTGGAALAFFDLELPSGLVIRDCKLMPGKSGGAWIATPAQKQTDRDGNPIVGQNGKPVWRELVGFRDRQTRDRFTKAVLDAFHRQHPTVLDAGTAS